MSPEHHLPWMTASVGGDGSGRKTNRRWGQGGSRQQMLAGETQCLGEVRAGWRVAGLEGGPPGCPMAPGQGWDPRLFRLGLAEKVSLAGHHCPGVLPLSCV